MFISSEEQRVHKQHKSREAKRPDLQRYQPVAGSARRPCDSEEGETVQSDPMATCPHEDDQPCQSEKVVSEKNLERHCGIGTDKNEEDRMRGDGSNTKNSEMSSQLQAKTEANQEKLLKESDKEHQEPTGAAKLSKKARKPDREFYQPGSRRNIQGKDCGVGKEQDKPPPRKHEHKSEADSQLSTGVMEGNKSTYTQKRVEQDKVAKCKQENIKVFKSSEINRKPANRDLDKPSLSSDNSFEIITSKVENLRLNERGKPGCETKTFYNKSGLIDKGRLGHGGGKKEDEEKVGKKRENENRRRRGEKEKDRQQTLKRGEDEVGGETKSNKGKGEKERHSRAGEVDGDKPLGKTGETHQSKGRDNRRESRRGDNNNRSREVEKDPKMEINEERAKEQVNRNKSNANITAPTSKRYSKSDIRRSRHRTYSSSSASSVTSLEGHGPGMDIKSTKLSHFEARHNNKEGKTNSGEGQRSHLQSWATNCESSTESLEGSEMSDTGEDKRRRQRQKERTVEQRADEKNRPQGNKGGTCGILRVSIDKQPGSLSHSGNVQRGKQGLAPRGRGGGILVLPARTDISNSPEVGQRLLFGGIRGGSAGRSRGGRGGGVRRLWDPNNPEMKPALTSTQSSQHSSLQQPIYLQTGTGYGPLHFLDTDDEVAGSPPVPQGEHFRTQGAAAVGYYKFQNSDNPYCFPMPTSNPQNLGNQRYPYPYHMGTYQMAPPNGMYPGPGVGQFCGNYRGTGYSQPAAGGSLTLEEVEQQARGELGRLLRAADAQELQLSNLLSRDRMSADGLDRMAQLR